MKLTPQTKRAAIAAIPVFLVLYVVHFFGAQFGDIGFTAETLLPGIVSSQSLKEAVMHPDRSDAYSAYDILGRRRSKVAHDIALRQLNSTDDYLWMNAAHYPGCINDPASIPYLIKALRHSACRADEERRQLLVKLTGRDFGTNFTKWHQWWLSEHPNFEMDWESHLGFQPRLRKGVAPLPATAVAPGN